MLQKKAFRPATAQGRGANLKLVYDIIRERRSVSRGDLADETGLSAMTITRVCSYLIEEGLIKEGAHEGGGVGRRAALLEPIARARLTFCIAIDYGDVQLAIYDMLMAQLAYREMDADESSSYEDIIDAAARALPEMAEECGVSPDDISAVGISCVGSVHDGILEFVAQFSWSNVRAIEYARSVFDLPVTIENDCKAALIGERALRYGLGGPENIAYIIIGKRGVGCAAIADGAMLRGADNMAGEIGHITAEADGMDCDCGRRGCIQTLLSEQFLLRRVEQFAPSVRSMRDLMNAAANGDANIIKTLDRMNHYMGVALNIVACAYNPAVILINDSYYLRGYHEWYSESKMKMPYYLFRPILEHVQVESALLGCGASLYGICRIAQDEILCAGRAGF